MFNRSGNIKRHLSGLFSWKRRLVALLLLLLSASPAHCEPTDPQQIISLFENKIEGISPEKKDSIKNALLSSYIQEYRNYGQEAAFDSLQARVNHLLKNKGESTSKKNTQVNNPAPITETDEEDNLSEIEVLQKENQELAKEIKRLKKELSSKKGQNLARNTTPAPDPTQSMISKEIKKTETIADSLTAQALKTGKEAVLEPIYFDSINHSDFLNYIHTSKLEYNSTTDTTKNNPLSRKTDIFLFQNKQRRRTVNALAISHPELIEYYNLSVYDSRSRDIRQSGKGAVLVDIDEYRAAPVFEKLSDFLKPKKQSNWSSNGKLNIQFSQYYVTKNWYKGGEPNATLLSLLEYYKDYNNNDKLIWNNGLDVKIGFFNSGNDTLRAFRVNNDVFQITSRLGYQTFLKKWYYSLYGEFNTCMFTGYAGTNSSEVVTAFLSPTRIFMSLGLDYRYNKNTSVLIAPLAYKLIFLTSDKIDPLTVGITSGKSSNSFGYMLQAKTNWKFTREISVNSNFNLFSTYDFKNVEFNWETTGNFTINRYLSTRLSLNMRFDNTPKKTDKNYEKPKLQIQEQLSFGFYYKF